MCRIEQESKQEAEPIWFSENRIRGAIGFAGRLQILFDKYPSGVWGRQ